LASQTLATEYNHAQIEPEHLLLALLQQSDGVVPQVVDRLGVRPPVLIRELETLLANRPKVYGGAQVGLSRAVSDIFIRAERKAGQMRDDYVSTEHVLLA
ncbi:MAG: type VI secretion system ATPase TssH, partial [Chloroflexota bacterium]